MQDSKFPNIAIQDLKISKKYEAMDKKIVKWRICNKKKNKNI